MSNTEGSTWTDTKEVPAKKAIDNFVKDLDQYIKLQASFSILLKAKYEALMKVGFSDTQATKFCEIAIANGKVVM